MIMAVFGLGAASQGIVGAEEARQALKNVFQLIDRETLIDPERKRGQKPDDVRGQVALEHVNFSYPSRPDIQVCNDYSLRIEPGMTVGIVGPR